MASNPLRGQFLAWVCIIPLWEPSTRKLVESNLSLVCSLSGLSTCLDALDDGTDRVAKGAASTGVLVHLGQVSLLVEGDGLVAGIVTSHVTLA